MIPYVATVYRIYFDFPPFSYLQESYQNRTHEHIEEEFVVTMYQNLRISCFGWQCCKAALRKTKQRLEVDVAAKKEAKAAMMLADAQ